MFQYPYPIKCWLAYCRRRTRAGIVLSSAHAIRHLAGARAHFHLGAGCVLPGSPVWDTRRHFVRRGAERAAYDKPFFGMVAF